MRHIPHVNHTAHAGSDQLEKQRRQRREGAGTVPNKSVRVTVYKFGQHLKTGVGAGTLARIDPTDQRVIHLLMHIAFGDSVDLERLEVSSVQLFLWPSGELLDNDLSE